MRRSTSLASAIVLPPIRARCHHTLAFHAQDPKAPVLRAVDAVRALDAAPTPRPVPKEAPLAIVRTPSASISGSPEARSASATPNCAPSGSCPVPPGRQCLGGSQSPLCRSRTYLVPATAWPSGRPKSSDKPGSLAQASSVSRSGKRRSSSGWPKSAGPRPARTAACGPETSDSS